MEFLTANYGGIPHRFRSGDGGAIWVTAVRKSAVSLLLVKLLELLLCCTVCFMHWKTIKTE